MTADHPHSLPRDIQHFHAHVYFDASTLAQARSLCAQAASLPGVAVGRVHERPVGPHPRWSCQLAFDRTQFDAVVAWLEAHRNGLDVLVHGQTGDALADHTTHARWLGQPWPLALEMFQQGG